MQQASSTPFVSLGLLGNDVLPAQDVELSAWGAARPGSLVELLRHPAAERTPIEPFEMELVQELIHASPEKWEPITEYRWGNGNTMAAARYADTELFGGALFAKYSCVLPHASADSCLYAIVHYPDRIQWDTQGMAFELRKVQGSQYRCETIYFKVRLFPLSDRDFLSFQMRQWFAAVDKRAAYHGAKPPVDMSAGLEAERPTLDGSGSGRLVEEGHGLPEGQACDIVALDALAFLREDAVQDAAAADWDEPWRDADLAKAHPLSRGRPDDAVKEPAALLDDPEAPLCLCAWPCTLTSKPRL